MIIKGKEVEARAIDELSSRKILSMGGGLLLTELHFEKGGIGAAHSHSDHEQVSYVVRGSFEATVGEETVVLNAGDSFYAGKTVVHSLKALEDSIILDVFTPIREEIL